MRTCRFILFGRRSRWWGPSGINVQVFFFFFFLFYFLRGTRGGHMESGGLELGVHPRGKEAWEKDGPVVVILKARCIGFFFFFLDE
jgi:hypothetical protein